LLTVIDNKDFPRNLFITLLLIMMFWLIMSAVRAQTVFDSVWINRVDIPMIVPGPGFTKPAETFDEEQFQEEQAKRQHGRRHDHDRRQSRNHRRVRSVDDCLTKQKARRKWPKAYLSWRGEHCWFAKRRRDE
jgi:hypothetical protein